MMQSNELVSIIVPIYNMERYLEECIKSIRKQTYKHIEIVLVDDGSTDKSYEICLSHQKLDKRIKVIQQKNSGVSVARNTGIINSEGSWVMFVDPDDTISEEIIESLLEKVSKDVEVIACTCLAFQEGKEAVCHFFDGDFCFTSMEEKKHLYKQLLDMKYGQKGENIFTAIGVPWGKLYKRSLLEKVRFIPTLKRAQDNIFNLEIFCTAKTVIYIDEPLYHYRFDHKGEYFKKYRKDLKDIFINVLKERERIFLEYDLISEKDLYAYYIREKIMILMCIVRYGILHENNPETMQDKIRAIDNVLENSVFDSCFKFSVFNQLNSLSQKIFWLLMKLKQYTLLNALFKII